MRLRTYLCGASALASAGLLCAMSTPAEAQSQAAQAAAQAQAQARAAAQAAQAAAGGIGSVIVTAQKREERLVRVPVAVTALTARQRDILGIKTIQDMTDYTPGFTYTTYDNRPYIRGIGRQTDNLAVPSGVATYVDGVYWGANAATILQGDSLFIERIDILRGPQNTLFGQNSDGGAINYVTVRPPRTWQAEVRGGWANYDKYFIEGAVGGPITDNLRFRAVGNWTEQTGGYYKNLDGPPEGGSVAQGGNGHSYMVEAQIEGSAFDNKLDYWAKIGSHDYDVTFHTESVVGPLPTQLSATVLMPNPLFGLCGIGYNAPGCAPGTNVDTLVPGSVVTLPHTPPLNPSSLNIRTFDSDLKSDSPETNNLLGAWQLTFHASGFDIKYLGGAQHFFYNLKAPWATTQGLGAGIEQYQLQGPAAPTFLCTLLFNDAGCTQNLVVRPGQDFFTFTEDDTYYSHELDFTSTRPGPFQWVGGLFYFHEHYDQPVTVGDPHQPQVAAPLSLAAFGAPAAANPRMTTYYVDTKLTDETFAVFFQGDYNITPAWKVTGGVRYTEDHKSGIDGLRYVLFNLDAFGIGVNAFGADTPAWDATPQACVSTPGGGGGACVNDAATGITHRPLDMRWNAVTGTAGLSWTPDPETLAYFQYHRGFKSGGFNSVVGATQFDAHPATRAESVDAFELGFKKVYGQTFQAFVEGFFYDYRNDQQPVSIFNTGLGIIGTSVANIGQVDIYGVELETTWHPIEPLTLYFNYSYLSAKIVNDGKGFDGKFQCFEDSNDPNALQPGANTTGCQPAALTGGVQLQNLKGQFVPNAPQNKISLSGIYTWTFDPGRLDLAASVVWRDSQYDSVFNRPAYFSPGYALVNLRGTWTDAQNRYTVTAFVDNVFDTLAYDGATALIANTAATVFASERSLIAPRTFCVELQYRFR